MPTVLENLYSRLDLWYNEPLRSTIMKFDLHCHIKGGSIDSSIDIDEYVKILRSKGFGGMLVTDHDSYKGFNAWESEGHKYDDFTVLKGIEYDTRDAGHFIVIMPDGIENELLTIRGMSLKQLIKVVHSGGGILGAAHPFGAKAASAMFCRKVRRNPDIFKNLDFLEGFNTCEAKEANEKAIALAKQYSLPCTGGSDSHNKAHVGKGFTDFSSPIKSNNDLIKSIKANEIKSFGGVEREFLMRHILKHSFPATWGFRAFNRSIGLAYVFRRRPYLSKLKSNK